MSNEKIEELEKIRNNKVNKQITKVVEQYGYKVSRCFFHPSYNVEAVSGSIKPTRKYQPQIHIESNGEIELQTTSYGTIKRDEFESYVADTKSGMDLVRALMEIDMTELEIL